MTTPQSPTEASKEARPDDASASPATAAGSVEEPAAERGEALLAARIAERDEAALSLVILRDVAIVSALLTLFGAAETWAGVSGLALATLVSTVNGLLVGAATGALLHEWGHLAGARLGGGHAPLKPIRGFLPIFDFDYQNNSARAFDWMGIGGNIAHWSVVLLFLFALPIGSAGTAALIAGAFGFAVFSSAIEIPVIRKSRGGMSGVEALGTIPPDFVRRYLPLALGAAAVAFLLL